MRLMIRISVLMLVVSLGATPCFAKLYKYKKDGVLYYTDAPPREMLQQSEALPESESSAPEPSPDGTPLLANHPARNAIEKAAAATVAVKGGLGYGSGFFYFHQRVYPDQQACDPNNRRPGKRGKRIFRRGGGRHQGDG